MVTFSLDAVFGSITLLRSSTSWFKVLPTFPRSITNVLGTTLSPVPSDATWVCFLCCSGKACVQTTFHVGSALNRNVDPNRLLKWKENHIMCVDGLTLLVFPIFLEPRGLLTPQILYGTYDRTRYCKLGPRLLQGAGARAYVCCSPAPPRTK